MSPTKSKPYKLKSVKNSSGNVVSDGGRRRNRLQSGDLDAEIEDIRRSIRSAAGIKTTSKEPRLWNPILKLLLDLEDDPTEGVRIFPRFAIWFLMLLVFWSRYLIINNHDGMAVIHPQEHFTAIEVAHNTVYGYGFQLNETLFIDPVLNGSAPAPTSWILRQVYTVLFRLRRQFNFEPTPFVLARHFHAAVASFTPWCVYHFTRTIYGQWRDISFMAANLVAFSKHLIVYGTHPFSQSLLSPLLFAAILIIYKVWPAKNDVVRSLALLLSGLVFGLVIYIQADSFLFLVAIFLLNSPSSITNKVQYLPSSLRLTSFITVATGAMLGLQFGAVQDRIRHHFWFITPIQLLQIRLANNMNVVNSLISFKGFLSGSHVHWALMTSAIICSLIYLAYRRRWTDLFDNWLNANGHEYLFKVTAKLTLTTAILLIYSVHPHQLWFTHDTLVLFLVAGSSAVYLLYRGLYIYIMSIANPQKTTRNVIKLIVYGEMFLYMFESRLTFPSSANQSISQWAHKGLWESAQVNWCLNYVGKQEDVTGVFIDFPAEMTGGYSLLHHKVPTIAVVGDQFREWDPKQRSFSDAYSLLNPQQLISYVVSNTTYNYAVITGGRKFFSHGFRKVYNDSDVRVYKRSKSFTERQKLEEAVSKIQPQPEVEVWQREAVSLLSMGLHDKAVNRLNTALEVDSTQLKLWQLLIHTVKQMTSKAGDGLEEIVNKCAAIFGPNCTDAEIDIETMRPVDNQWNITYRFI